MSLFSRSPDGIGAPLLAAGAVFGLCALGIAAWTAQAPVASAVLAGGEIAVEGASKTVQHLEGGIVAEILAVDGLRVAAGDPLARLDTTEAEAERAALVAERDALAARAARLRAELADLPAPDFVALAARGSPTLASAVAGETALFEARAAERAAELDMLGGTLERLAARSRGIGDELEGIDAQLALVDEDTAAMRALADKGVASRAALRDAERALVAMRGARAAMLGELSDARAAEAETRLARAEAETGRVSAISGELVTVSARLAEIAPSLDAAERRIARGELRAPVSGTVTGLSIATVGGVIAPGEPILTIVPDSAVLVAEARLLPRDRERLIPGMSAEVRLPGLEGRAATGVNGTVARISADRVAATAAGEDAHYLMTVELAEGAGTSLVPGMPITVVVPTKPRTVVDYLLSPIRDAIGRSMREV